MNTDTKRLMSEIETEFNAQLQTIRLIGRQKQTMRRAFKRQLKLRLTEYESRLPKQRRYRLSSAGRRRLQLGIAKTRAKSELW